MGDRLNITQISKPVIEHNSEINRQLNITQISIGQASPIEHNSEIIMELNITQR